jgi:hypothetical protein
MSSSVWGDQPCQENKKTCVLMMYCNVVLVAMAVPTDPETGTCLRDRSLGLGLQTSHGKEKIYHAI